LTRRDATAGARLLNAVFFLAVSAYGVLSYSPFAYEQFIKPNVVPALTDFVLVSPWLFWLALLITLLTLMPALRAPRRVTTDPSPLEIRSRARGLAWAYVAASVVTGVAVTVRPPLAMIGNSWRAFAIGLIALVPPIWLAALDHAIWPSPVIERTTRGRALAICSMSALVAWAVYALGVPFRLRDVIGIDLPARALAFAFGSSLILDVIVFATLCLVLVAVIGAIGVARGGGAPEYWLFVAVLAICAGAVLYSLVCASIAFTGVYAAMASAWLGCALAVVWADLARLRSDRSPDGRQPAGDSLSLFGAPVAGSGSRVGPALVLAVLPVVAYELVDAVSHFDWNFLLQKLGVLIVWLLAFAAIAGVTGRPRRGGRRTSAWLALTPLVVLTLYAGFGWMDRRADAAAIIDGYAAVDPSFRLIRDASTTRSADTVEYYARLRAHTLVAPRDVQPPAIDFVRPLRPVPGQKPDIFLIVIDSVRRDYLSPYNPGVTFTPEIAKLAADSVVFERAFSRYSGTALAVPSIWAGGMVIHALAQPAFGDRNTLLKLLNANGYVRMMGMDHITHELVPRDAHLDELDRDTGTMDVDLCGTIDELSRKLRRTAPPVFFYSLPQNVHLAVAAHRKVPAGESYPGFFAPVASTLWRIDACLGRLVDVLKETDRYDNSVIIVTSDHGDSLGEEGRWGHAYFVHPEVMRIPLIVHVPSRPKPRLVADAAAVSFSTDIAPSLYALLGYEPADLGALYGRPLFVTPEADGANADARRQQPFLLASSYGAVYATLRENGRHLYVVDAVEGRDYAYDLSVGLLGRRVDTTQTMMNDNRREILHQLSDLAAPYHPPAR
jgi:hypothetical protein